MEVESKATRQVISTSQKRRHRFRSFFGLPDMNFAQAANHINLKHVRPQICWDSDKRGAGRCCETAVAGIKMTVFSQNSLVKLANESESESDT